MLVLLLSSVLVPNNRAPPPPRPYNRKQNNRLAWQAMLKLDISAGMLRMKDIKTSAPAEMSRERQFSCRNVQYKCGGKSPALYWKIKYRFKRTMQTMIQLPTQDYFFFKPQINNILFSMCELKTEFLLNS